jgi:hypothetical protein
MPIATDTPLTYPTYTNRNLDDGVFEQLMAAVKHHVAEEFKNGRIQADQYGQVYLGLTEACLQNSTQYLLGLLLIDEKRRGQDLANQKSEYELEILLPAQLDKLLKEIEVMDKQMEFTDKQMEKIDKEIEFLIAKILTERANTEAGIAAAESLIGKQLSLLTAQRLGFAGDLQVKVGKLYADYDGIFQSVQEIEGNTTLSSNHLAPENPELTRQKLDVAESIADSIAALT